MSTSESASAPIGRFGNYLVYSESRQGGMGTIYRAKQSAGSPDWLAIKCLRLDTVDTGMDCLKAFAEEALAMKRLDHANVVRLIDYGKEKEVPFLVMEWVNGRSLREVLSRARARDTQLPIRLCLHVIQQAALGLQYIHRRGVIHRDLTPHNIMVGFDGAIKIIDFGIAKTMDSQEHTRVGLIKGKPGYLSPEQVKGAPLTPSVDVFTLGIMLWETLTGGRLFKGRNTNDTLKMIAEAEHHVRPPSRYRPEISPELDDVVLRALKQDPRERYATAIELHDDLARCLSTGLELTIDHLDLERFMAELFRSELAENKYPTPRKPRSSRAGKQALPPPPPLGENSSSSASVSTSAEVLPPPSRISASAGSPERLELVVSSSELHRLRSPGHEHEGRQRVEKLKRDAKAWRRGTHPAGSAGKMGRRKRKASAPSKLWTRLAVPLALVASLAAAFYAGMIDEVVAKRFVGTTYASLLVRLEKLEPPQPPGYPARRGGFSTMLSEQAIVARRLASTVK